MKTRKKINQRTMTTTRQQSANSSTTTTNRKNVKKQNNIPGHVKNEDDNVISNLQRMSVDELISYVETQLGQDWENEMGFSPGFVREMLSGDGALEFKSLLLSNLFPQQSHKIEEQKPKQEEEEKETNGQFKRKTPFIKEESPVTIKYETYFHCTNIGCCQKFICEEDLQVHTAFCYQPTTNKSEQKPELNEINTITNAETDTKDTKSNYSNNNDNKQEIPDSPPSTRRFNLRERKNRQSKRKLDSDIEIESDNNDNSDKNDDDEIFKPGRDSESESISEQQDDDEDGQEEAKGDSASDFEPIMPKKRKRNPDPRRNRERKRKRKIYTCTTAPCSITFQDKQEWVEHQLRIHNICPMLKGIKTCLRCEITFETQAEREEHEETHADIKPVKCPLCWRRFCRKDNLRKHERMHKRTEIYYYCNYPKCTYRCTRTERLRLHYRTTHMKRVDDNTVYGFEDRRGSDVAEEEDGFVLIEPGTEIETEKQQSTIYKCPVPKCSVQYAWRRSLVDHMAKLHPKHLPFTCKQCDKKFGLEYYHDLHVERVHTIPARCGLKWSCEYEGCDKEYKCKKSLEVHIRTHVGDFRYACTHEGCDKKFAGIKNFRQHLRTHEDIKKYKCPECDYRSAHQTAIKFHMGSHHNKKILQCEQCNYSCVFIGALKNHVRSKHTNERPFKCTICENTYATQGALRSHVVRFHIRKGNYEETNSGTKSNQNTNSKRNRKKLEDKEEGEENNILKSSDEEDGNLHLDLESENENDEEWNEQQGNERISISTSPSKSDKSYQCTHEGCSLTFIQGSDLRQHMKTHAPPTEVTPPTITIRTRKSPQRKPTFTHISLDRTDYENPSENLPIVKSESEEHPQNLVGESEKKERELRIETTISQFLTEDVKPGQIKEET